jgi:hypothetical protein
VALAQRGMTGLSGLQPTGAAPAPADRGMMMSPSQGLTFEGSIPNLNDTWLSQDLKNPSIDWSIFSPTAGLEYESLLDRNYKKRDTTLDHMSALRAFGTGKIAQFNPYTGKMQSSFDTYAPINGRVMSTSIMSGKPQNQASGRFALDPNKVNFSDANIDAAIDQLNNAALGKLQPVADWDYNQRFETNPMMRAVQGYTKPKEFDYIDPESLNRDVWNKSPVEMIRDAGIREQLFGDVAKSTGIGLDDLKGHYNKYTKAYNSLSDPVGANWQDIKRVGAAYANEILPGVRRYSGYGDDFFNKLNSSVSEGTRNQANYLDPEYFALHTITPNNSYRGKAGARSTEMIGATNPNAKATFDQFYRPTDSIAMRKGANPQGMTDPYSQTDWTDFLGAGVTSLNATAEDKAAAMRDMQIQRDRMTRKVRDGGQFNLWRESDAQPYQVMKAGEAGKWRPRNSGYTNQLNIAQNFLNKEGDGQKSFRDLGYDENEAWKSGFFFDKKEKSGLGGGLGMLAGLASFIPGPVGIAARVVSAVNSVANKDYLGAVLSGISMIPGANNPLTKVTSALSKSARIPMSLANSIVQGGMGGLGAVSKGGNFAKGALGAGVGSFASGELGNILAKKGIDPTIAGALSGAGGSVINAGLQGAKGAPLLLSAAQGAVSGYGRGRNIRDRQRRVRA